MQSVHQFLLRPIGDSDTDRVIAWRNAPESRIWFRDSREITAEGHRGWLSMRHCLEEFNFILEVDGIPSAFGAIYGLDRVGLTAEIGRFLVDPARRGKGLGRLLCTAIVDEAFGLPYLDSVHLEVKADNVVAISLYRSLGFLPLTLKDGGTPFLRFAIRRGEWVARRFTR